MSKQQPDIFVLLPFEGEEGDKNKPTFEIETYQKKGYIIKSISISTNSDGYEVWLYKGEYPQPIFKG